MVSIRNSMSDIVAIVEFEGVVPSSTAGTASKVGTRSPSCGTHHVRNNAIVRSREKRSL